MCYDVICFTVCVGWCGVGCWRYIGTVVGLFVLESDWCFSLGGLTGGLVVCLYCGLLEWLDGGKTLSKFIVG